MFKFLKIEKEEICHECAKAGHAIRFRLFNDRNNVSILCWACFGPAMNVLMDLGVLYRHPREPEVFSVVQHLSAAPAGGQADPAPNQNTYRDDEIPF